MDAYSWVSYCGFISKSLLIYVDQNVISYTLAAIVYFPGKVV